MAASEKDLYSKQAGQYGDLADLPVLRMEREMVIVALASSSCEGARVLDIGGGDGVQAREAVNAGASLVDVVDVADGMLKNGVEMEEKLGRKNKINYFLADCSAPLDHLGLQKQSYDIVIANGMFVHTENMAILEGMWTNIAAYIKPGGRFLGVRVDVPDQKSATSGQYGVTHRDIADIPDGVGLQADFHVEPLVTYHVTCMKPSLYKSTELDEKYGFENIKFHDGQNTKLVKEDPEFWAEWLKNPVLTMATSVKSQG